MTDANGNQVLSQLLSTVGQFATPFAQALAYGKENAGELALAQERVKYAQLNGSGPNDRTGALTAAGGIRDFLFGSPFVGSSATPIVASPMSGMLLPLLAVGLVGLLIFKFVKR